MKPLIPDSPGNTFPGLWLFPRSPRAQCLSWACLGRGLAFPEARLGRGPADLGKCIFCLFWSVFKFPDLHMIKDNECLGFAKFCN